MQVAIDLGGTTGRVAAFNSTDDLKVVRRQDFSMNRQYEHDQPALVKTIREVLEKDTLEGIGICIAGAVDPSGTTITGSGSMAGWHHHPIVPDLEQEFGVPVKLANDAYSAALSEAMYVDHSRPFWFMVWGTGIAGAYAVPGNPPHVMPSEFGHAVLDWDAKNETCGCGQTGCLESFAGGSKIELNRGKKAEDLTEAEWDEVIGYVAKTIHSLIATLPTERVVFGGGISVKQAHRLPKIEELVEKSLRIYPAPKVSLIAHGEDAGLVGALALLR